MIEGNEVTDEQKRLELAGLTDIIVSEGSEVTVVDQDSYDAAAKFCERVKQRIKAVQAFFSPLKIKAHEAHKAITSEENNKLKPLKDAFNAVEGARTEWFREEERKIKEAEAEGRRREAEAERERAAEEKGETPEPIAAPEPEPEPETTPAPAAPRASAGTKMRRTWKGRVTNMGMLIASVAEGAAPDNILKIDQAALDRYAKKIKGGVEVPGMEAYEDVKSTY